jgi:hypothetical protein
MQCVTPIGIKPLSELDKNTDGEPTPASRASPVYMQRCAFPDNREFLHTRKRNMTKNLALAASITMLTAISGQAFADTASPNARYWSNATDSSDRQVVNAFNAFDRAMAAQTAEPNAYRYHGGPKSND